MEETVLEKFQNPGDAGRTTEEKLRIINELIEKINKTEKTLECGVEGNIGSGKSSFLNMFNDIECVNTILECVKIWEKLGILEDFYKHPQKYALLFQSITFTTRLAALGRKRTKKITIFERSVWADRYCFAENLAEDGLISQKELVVYQIWHRILINGHINKTVPDVIIYLRASPQTSKRRQENRGRKSESVIPLEYFEKLHEKHERWLIETETWSEGSIGVPSYKQTDDSGKTLTNYMKNAPVYVVDIDEDFSCPLEYKIFVLEKFLDVINKYGKTEDERAEFNKKLDDLTKFPDEEEIIQFIDQLSNNFSKQ